MEKVSFEVIPRSTRIYLDYLSRRSNLIRYYAGDWTSLEEQRALAARLCEGTHDRQRLFEVLREQNRALGADAAALSNIDRLRDPRTVAVVTGQQAGLFSGPLYTLIKALGAVRWASRMTELGIPAIPVFWSEVEDHDIEEVAHCGLPDRDGVWREIDYRPVEWVEGRPVGRVILDEAAGYAVDQLVEALPDSEYVRGLAPRLRAAYTSGARWGDAFGRLMLQLTSGTGLVWIDPSESEIKGMLGPLYSRVLAEPGHIARALMKRSAQLLQAGYHNQFHVTPEMVPLFLIDEGRRRTLMQINGAIRPKVGDQVWAPADLSELARTSPQTFSPSGALRPVAQDTLLPTLMYVGGPSEIAYFAQLQPMYELLGVTQPMLAPRPSVTIVEPKYARTLEKYGIGVRDLFAGPDEILREIARRSVGQELTQAFASTEAVVTERMAAIQEQLGAADPTLVDAARNALEKMQYQISNLKTKFLNAQARRDATAEQQIRRACTVLAPERRLQERRVNGLYFYARYGPTFLPWLRDAIDLDTVDHQVLTYDG
ncbi:MAG: bacillithiol biosynthesis cysteine-adding enzyme BshC [Acidobacteria bacterium]|nr:bacillithiol biosynthesis cysteine-adding enzyme BshC [Acidobacteriota bacterium]